jgi:hypothetical protein
MLETFFLVVSHDQEIYLALLDCFGAFYSVMLKAEPVAVTYSSIPAAKILGRELKKQALESPDSSKKDESTSAGGFRLT